MRIAVDPGHGGRDPGATAHGLQEADINLDIAHEVRLRLEHHGHDVLMTRRKDRTLSLPSRARFANSHGADAFVSIHANAAASEYAEGFEVFCFPGSSMGDVLAAGVIRKLAHAFPDHKNRGVKEADFHVLRKTSMPAVLVEAEFLTHPQQAVFLSTQQDRIGVAIADGVNWSI